MQMILYFLIALFATAFGSVSGMGGGIIIKPVLDSFGQYDASTIGILSSITVLTMALVSVGKQFRHKSNLNIKTALPLLAGSVFGGFIGQFILSAVISVFKLNRLVTLTQNIILAVLIAVIFTYMKNKHKVKGLSKSGVLPALLCGLLLGILSSFLGIGGGPFNVALLIFVFSVDTKTATVYSLLTILFAQVSKISTVAISEGLLHYDLSMLPGMMAGAVTGGFLGTHLNQKCSDKFVERAFNLMQLLVLCICISNIVKALV